MACTTEISSRPHEVYYIDFFTASWGLGRRTCFTQGVQRGLICGAFGVVGVVLVGHLAALAAVGEASRPEVVERFLAGDKTAPSYRALRRLEAGNDKRQAWMDVWTEVDASGFRYEVVSQGGSGYIRSKVFKAALEAERKISATGTAHLVAITPANYLFEDRGADPAGLARVGLMPRRKDLMLVQGSIFLRPSDGDLVRIQGSLAKPPSVWIRHVDIDRRYERIGGVRMPVSLQSVARVLVLGKSTFTVTYQYETVNGQHVGSPVPRLNSEIDSPEESVDIPQLAADGL